MFLQENLMYDFSNALRELVKGRRIARSGWNGKNMWLVYITDYSIHQIFDGSLYPLLNFIAMKTADNKMVPWLASQTDILANDWNILD